VRALSRFILAVSDLVEAHAVELRHECERLISFALLQLAGVVLLLGGVGLVLTGTFLVLQHWVGAAGASFIAGGLALTPALGVTLWLHLRHKHESRGARLGSNAHDAD
jgi:hypothetical protein